MNTIEDNLLTATTARILAKRINRECSECFSDAKAKKEFGRWVVTIGGGRQCCYGRTVETLEGGLDLIRIFKNDNQ